MSILSIMRLKIRVLDLSNVAFQSNVNWMQTSCMPLNTTRDQTIPILLEISIFKMEIYEKKSVFCFSSLLD